MASATLNLEQLGNTLVVVPLEEHITKETHQGTASARIFRAIENVEIENIVIDLLETKYLNSTAIEVFVRLWRRMQERSGQFVFASVSPFQEHILKTMNLDRVWPIFESREAALRSIQLVPLPKH